ncbi:hypothetical protein Tco_0058143 [Tanacetum coccineum]
MVSFGRISPNSFLSSILLVVVIIITVVIVVVILIVVVVAIVGVVIVVAIFRVVVVVDGVSSIFKLSFMIIGFLDRIIFISLIIIPGAMLVASPEFEVGRIIPPNKASLVRVPVQMLLFFPGTHPARKVPIFSNDQTNDESIAPFCHLK